MATVAARNEVELGEGVDLARGGLQLVDVSGPQVQELVEPRGELRLLLPRGLGRRAFRRTS